MLKAPDGTVVDESSSDKGAGAAVGGTEREAEECEGKNPNPAGGAGARPHAGNAVLGPRSHR